MKYTPHPYQAYSIGRVLDSPALALWLDMGLGKTIITLTAVNELKYNRLAVQRVLIVAPKKVAEATWQNEAKKWDHLRMLRFSEILGTAEQRRRAIWASADIYIINRDNVAWLVDECGSRWPFDMVVLDEASSFKNHQAKRFKKLKAVRPRIARIVELTGTPAPRDLMDLWAQIYLLDEGKRLGKTITSYREEWFKPDKRNAQAIFSYKARDGARSEIQQRLGDICVSMKAADYITLPDMVENDIPVILDTAARRAYDQMEKNLLLPVGEQIIDAGTAAVLRGKLLQIASGAVYDDSGTVAPVHGCKVESFTELIEALDGQHALVFYAYKHDKARITAALEKSGLRVRNFDGPKDADDWNAGKIDILLAHPASCAYGLNLQAGGHHVIWFGLTDSLELYQQANARLHRQGQDAPVIVHRLIVQGTADEDVIAGLAAKDKCQEALLQAMKARIKKWKESAT